MQPKQPKRRRWEDLWLTPDQQGAQRLAAGDASGAAERFDQSSWRGMAEFEAAPMIEQPRALPPSHLLMRYLIKAMLWRCREIYKAPLTPTNRAWPCSPAQKMPLRIATLFSRCSTNKKIKSKSSKREKSKAKQDEQSEQNDSSDSDSGGDGESSDQQDDSQQAGDGQEDDTNDQGEPQEESEQQAGDQAPNTADEDQQAADQLEAATQEQMAKFDEALEEQQALEQWLRRVPDDPGGLLRRKFRYQSMQRLREGDKPDESIRW